MTEEKEVKVKKTAAKKTVTNTDVAVAKEAVSDLEVFGNGNLFQLLTKVSSKKEGWMKSTKAMQTPVGVVIQVTTQKGAHIAEALTFVPGVKVVPIDRNNKEKGLRLATM